MKSQIKKPFLNKVGWWVMCVLAVFMFLIASPYLGMNPDTYFVEQKLVYMAHTSMLIMHIVGAMLATIIGPFQFLERIRKGRVLNVHRWMGRIYLLGVLFGGIGGLYLAPLAYGGLPARLGFATLGILWLFSGYMAYKNIRNKKIEAHREWMTRNYALTFAAVTLRLWLITLGGIGVEFLVAYITVAWLCWIPNLFVAEWIIINKRKRLNKIEQLSIETA